MRRCCRPAIWKWRRVAKVFVTGPRINDLFCWSRCRRCSEWLLSPFYVLCVRVQMERFTVFCMSDNVCDRVNERVTNFVHLQVATVSNCSENRTLRYDLLVAFPIHVCAHQSHGYSNLHQIENCLMHDGIIHMLEKSPLLTCALSHVGSCY